MEKTFFRVCKYQYPPSFKQFLIVRPLTWLTPLSTWTRLEIKETSFCRRLVMEHTILLLSWGVNFEGLPLFAFLLSNTGSPFIGFWACLYIAALEYGGNIFKSFFPRIFDNWYAALIWAECSNAKQRFCEIFWPSVKKLIKLRFSYDKITLLNIVSTKMDNVNSQISCHSSKIS
jgi:hypothetical protein